MALPKNRKKLGLKTAPLPILDEETLTLKDEYVKDDVFEPLEELQDEDVDLEEDDYQEVFLPELTEEVDLKEATKEVDLVDLEQPKEEYMDKQNKKIIPFGGKKAKIKDSDLDTRNNKLFVLKAFRLGILLVILFIVGLGIKNTFFPEQIYTNEEITAISQRAIGRTGFPEQLGQAYSQAYLKEYLTLTYSKTNKQVLDKLTTGKLGDGSTTNQEGRNGKPSEIKPASEPILIESKLLSPYSALFTYNVYLTDEFGRISSDTQDSTGQWVSFSMNVYYDKETKAVSVVGDPIMVPNYTIRKPSALPQAKPLGNGQLDSDMANVLQPTIHGFIKAYANVTVNNFEEIAQYIPSSKPVDLISGFGGTVRLKNGDSSIIKTVYKTDDPNEWKVDIQLEWTSRSVRTEDLSPSFNSHYVMTIRKTEENVYLVTKFAPYLYLKEK